MAQRSPEDAELIQELDKIAGLIARPQGRKSFSDDPYGTLERAKVNLEVVPRGVVDTLAGLSAEELEVVSKFSEGLVAAGLRLGKDPDIHVSFF